MRRVDNQRRETWSGPEIRAESNSPVGWPNSGLRDATGRQSSRLALPRGREAGGQRGQQGGAQCREVPRGLLLMSEPAGQAEKDLAGPVGREASCGGLCSVALPSWDGGFFSMWV